MQIEVLDDASRQRMYRLHQEETQYALVQVFEKSEEDASRLVRELWSRYDTAPPRERDLLLHNDPVALACDLAEEVWSNVSKARLDKFNRSRKDKLGEHLQNDAVVFGS
jgi:hypothetical protein